MLRDDEEVTGAAEPARPAGRQERTLTLCVVCSALFLALLDSTVVGLALPTVRRDLGADLTGLQWVVLGYVCPYAALLLTGGYLGDRFGRRRVFLAGTAVFTAGSLLCAAAGSAGFLAAGRAVQGIGAAAVTPQTLALLRQVFPGERERAKALSTWSAVSGLALLLGPVAGGASSEVLGWRSVFLLNVPVGLFALAAGRRLPAPAAGPRRPFDRTGHLLIVTCLGAAAYGLVEGPRAGWSAPPVAAALVPAGAAALALLTVERRTAHPALRLDLFRGPVFTGATSVTFLMAVALNAAYLVLSLLLQVLDGASPAQAGMRLLPTMAAIVVGAVAAGRATRRLAPWQLVAAGTSLAGLSLLSVAALAPGHSYALWWPGATLMGLGMGLVMSPNNGAMIGGVRPEDAGQAAAMGGVLQQVGALLGVASLGAVLGSAVLDASTGPARAGLASGLRHGLLLAGVCCLLATAVTVLLTRPRGRGGSGTAPTRAQSPPTARRTADDPGGHG
ncbi:MFS transporter [Streptomyces sp. NPDC006274]|uniref:MFS transporter n=1 Tax=unclassified Streptomyces TaxID=2593676 RepID=UPI0033A15E35